MARKLLLFKLSLFSFAVNGEIHFKRGGIKK